MSCPVNEEALKQNELDRQIRAERIKFNKVLTELMELFHYRLCDIFNGDFTLSCRQGYPDISGQTH